MKRQKKQFILVCFLLLVGIAVLFGLKVFNKKQEEKAEQTKKAETISVAHISQADIDSFTYQYEEKEIAFEKQKETWYLKTDHTIPISQSLISTMLSSVEDITASQQITATEDTAQYGFEQPANVIKMQIGEDTMDITIGMFNQITSQDYLMISGSDNVYLVDSSISAAFQKSVADLTEKEQEETEIESETGE